MEYMESLLLILKLLGVVFTAAFGIIGTMQEFRSQSGKLTKWGKAAVVGALVSLFVAVSAQFVDNHLQKIAAQKAAAQALDSTQRTEKIVSELNRTMQPIESISVFVADLGVPMDDPLLQDYKVRLDNGLEEFLRSNPLERPFPPGMAIPGTKSVNGISVPSHITVSRSSPLFPDPHRESLARAVLDVEFLELAFYKVRIDASEFRPFFHGFSHDPDLRVECFIKGSLNIQKSLETETFQLTGLLGSERAHWENNTGKIAAIPDLVNAQLFIAVGPLGVEGQNDQFLELRRRFSLNDINLSFGNRSRWIRSSMVKQHSSADGVTFWEFIFPGNEADLFADQ
jgi:hypothetical protein